MHSSIPTPRPSVSGPQIVTPEWVRDAVFYQIFPDRFAKSSLVPKANNLQLWDDLPDFHSYKGGDLLGVVEHLDYLGELGVNAIYLNPIFQSASSHRYHTHDYYRVDPMLGGDAALRALLDAAHARGMRVILDGVFNHASRGFFQFHDILENGRGSAYIDWFTVLGYPLNAYNEALPPNYEAWWNLHALPKFNVGNPAVREFLLGVAEYWIRFGADGWRLDVPAEIKDDTFWQEFRQRVRAANPEAYIVGEIWHDARHWLRGDQFDAVMNYLFTKLCMEFFIASDIDPALVSGTSLWPVRRMQASEFANEIGALLKLYPTEVTSVQLNLLESHDTARFVTMAGGDASALRLATLFQMVYPGAPCIYYGSEVGMAGGRDPYSRGGFPWDPSRWDTTLLDYFKRAAALRHARPALRRGEYYTLLGQGSVYALARKLGEERIVAAFNAGRETVRATLPVAEVIPPGSVVRNLWHEGGTYSLHGGVLLLDIPARSAMVLEATAG